MQHIKIAPPQWTPQSPARPSGRLVVQRNSTAHLTHTTSNVAPPQSTLQSPRCPAAGRTQSQTGGRWPSPRCPTAQTAAASARSSAGGEGVGVSGGGVRRLWGRAANRVSGPLPPSQRSTSCNYFLGNLFWEGVLKSRNAFAVASATLPGRQCVCSIARQRARHVQHRKAARATRRASGAGRRQSSSGGGSGGGGSSSSTSSSSRAHHEARGVACVREPVQVGGKGWFGL